MMMRFFGAALAVATALGLGFGGHSPAHAEAIAVRSASAEWAHARSDLKPDPAIRFGVLPNGMRYALRRQTAPVGQTALRLWIGAGSLHEDDDQRGLAHFLEHMAFNGSKGVKEGEMVKILERLGLAFGADTNASTGFSETLYKLDLPRSDAATIDASLMLLRETASNLLIAPAAVERERGVILAEERTRDTPGYRVVVRRMEFLFKGQRLPTRLPIGDVEIIRKAPASRISDYYTRWYRPERAVLIAVGDFDIEAMEAKVRKDFATWVAAGPPSTDPDAGAVAIRGPDARIVVEPGTQSALQIIWTRAPDLSPDTAKRRADELIEGLGLAVLNRRLSRLGRNESPPFQGAAAFQSRQDDVAEMAGVAVNVQPERWRGGLTTVEQEVRRLVQYGVDQAELDREIEETRAALAAAAAGAATRRPTDLAAEIVASLSDRVVVTSPADDLALFEAAAKALQAEAVTTALPRIFQGQGPLVFLASPTPIEGGEAAVLTALDASRRVEVKPLAGAARIAWPYDAFGVPGKVAARRTIRDIDTTFVRFRNGVRLTVKPTTFRDDEAQVRVNVGRGALSLPSDRQSPYWAASALIEGGLKALDVEQMEAALAAKVYGARFSIADDAFVLSGSTRTGDLPTQLQVLAAYLTAPGWREAAFQRIKTSGETIHAQYDATPGGVLARDLSALTRSGDRRWTFPTKAEIAAASLSDLRDVVAPVLATNALEIVVVGDVDVDKVIADVAATFGALPRRPTRQRSDAASARVAFPAPTGAPVVLTHKGRDDQAAAYMAWPTTDYWADPQRARDIAVLREVMRLRLLEQFREADGVTYSPDVSSQHSQVWTGWGFISASLEAPQDKLDDFFAGVEKIAQDLRTREVSPDELARAKQPRLEGLRKARQTNGYWLSELSGAQVDPRRLGVIRDIVPGTERITAADLRRAAQARLIPGGTYKVVVIPEGSAQAAARPSP